MRARLDSMTHGQQYTFLCVPKMAEAMKPIIFRAGGEIALLDIRSYGVIMSVRKKA